MSDNAASKGVPTLEALAQQRVQNALKDVYTSTPGIIDSFDPDTQTCTIPPAIHIIFDLSEA